MLYFLCISFTLYLCTVQLDTSLYQPGLSCLNNKPESSRSCRAALTNLGQQFGTTIWDNNLGQQFGTTILDRQTDGPTQLDIKLLCNQKRELKNVTTYILYCNYFLLTVVLDKQVYVPVSPELYNRLPILCTVLYSFHFLLFAILISNIIHHNQQVYSFVRVNII